MSLEIEVSVPSPPAITVTVEPGGAQGPQGEQGEQGEQGPAGEIDPTELEEAIEDYLTANPPTGGTWGSITGTLADQTDLDAALDAKSDTGHSHAQSDVTGLTAALDGKADDAHTHTASEVTDFNTAADARVVAGITGKLDTSAAPELIRDTIGTALVAGTNVTLTVNDGSDTITIANTVSPIAAGSANNPHTTEGAARNSALTKNFWQYTGTAGVNDPDNWIAGDEWISA
jgi:hypothetical protein